MSSERSRLSAKRFNKFIERASQACLTVGLAITTAALVALSSQPNALMLALWAAAGIVLIVFSLILPIWLESEE